MSKSRVKRRPEERQVKRQFELIQTGQASGIKTVFTAAMVAFVAHPLTVPLTYYLGIYNEWPGTLLVIAVQLIGTYLIAGIMVERQNRRDLKSC